MDKKTQLIILGLGNILLGDEGFGVHFIRWLRDRYTFPDTIEVIDGGTLGYGLLDIVSRCTNLVVIDVIRVDDSPGSIYRFSKDEMEITMPEATSAHEVEFFHVLLQAELMDHCPSTTFVCIVPARYGEMNLEMTPVMHERFPDMEKLVMNELSLLDITPEQVHHA